MSKKNNKQNNSMFIYTALIFVVALIFIILAFFGQTNLSNLRNETENISPSEAVQTEDASAEATPQPTPASNEELAIMANTISSLRSENDDLKRSITVYDLLLSANGYISVDNLNEAENIINKIDRNNLNDDQKILFDQIITKINEGKEE